MYTLNRLQHSQTMGAKHPSLAQQIRDIRYDACVLQAQAKRSEQDAVKAQEATRVAHQQGLADIAHTHARTAVIAQRHASTTYAMAARLTALVSKLQQVQATTKLASSLAALTAKLKMMVRDTSNVDVLMQTFEASMAELDQVDALTSGGLDKLHGEVDVSDVMERVDDQVGLEVACAMPDVAVTIRRDHDSLEERYAQLID